MTGATAAQAGATGAGATPATTKSTAKKAGRAQRRDQQVLFRVPGLVVWTTIVVIFILAPLVVVALVAFTATDFLSLPTEGVSFRWFAATLDRPVFIEAFWNSVKLAAAASAASLLLGLMVAVALVRYKLIGRRTLESVVMSPLFVPVILTGLAILIVSAQLGGVGHGSRLFVGHVVVTLPYVVRTIIASLVQFDMNQELAARDLGATPLKAFRLVTLPQIGPGLFAAGMFAAIVSIDNVGISLFLQGSDFRVLPVELYTYAHYNNDPLSAAVSVVLILVSVLGIAALQKFFGLQKLLSVR
jgi:putative spermidine/putrescine transport system permease protein